MKFKSILIAFIILHLLLIAIGLLSPGMSYTSVLGFIICFCFSVNVVKYFNNNHPTYKVLFILVMIRLLLFGGLDLYMSITEIANLPFLIIHLLGIISGFFYIRLENSLRFIPFFLSFILTAFMVFQGWDYWLHYRNFDTFTGKVSYPLPTKFEAFDEAKNLIVEQDFNGKIVLLDFWTTTCGICFKKFPQVQAVYDKYRNNSSVIILAVNSPIEEDRPNQAFEMIRERGHNFPVVITKGEDLAEKFGVKGYPTTFVINRNGQIIFKGDIEGAIKMVDELKRSDL